MKKVEPKKITYFIPPTITVYEGVFNDCSYPDDISRELDKRRSCGSCMFRSECMLFSAKSVKLYAHLVNSDLKSGGSSLQ
jgi:hypothetical protein